MTAFYPYACKGWRTGCGTLVTRETERIFGEVILCEPCYELAWADYFLAISDAGEWRGLEDDDVHAG